MTAKTPTGLGKAGRELWLWLDENFETAGAHPMAVQLCRIADQLDTVRKAIAKDGMIDAQGKKHVLLDAEPKLLAQYKGYWRTLGLADKPEAPRRSVGRPTNLERQSE